MRCYKNLYLLRKIFKKLTHATAEVSFPPLCVILAQTTGFTALTPDSSFKCKAALLIKRVQLRNYIFSFIYLLCYLNSSNILNIFCSSIMLVSSWWSIIIEIVKNTLRIYYENWERNMENRARIWRMKYKIFTNCIEEDGDFIQQLRGNNLWRV